MDVPLFLSLFRASLSFPIACVAIRQTRKKRHWWWWWWQSCACMGTTRWIVQKNNFTRTSSGKLTRHLKQIPSLLACLSPSLL
ncbi:hypothetical protein BKA81DRAFT_10575 [Phyllosticta paracitricarpa]|uniref:Secreted protein n=1 Tax=Phyllosticta citricarpa TaxID=55181 RepID=A0ABR1MRM7_9PEZI